MHATVLSALLAAAALQSHLSHTCSVVGLLVLLPCLFWDGPACSRHNTALLPSAFVCLLMF